MAASCLGLVGPSQLPGAATGGAPASSEHAALAIGAQPTPRDSAAVAAVVGGFHDALARGDSAAALALLAPDVRILESGGVELMVLTRTAGGWRISAIHWSSRRRTS